MLGGPNRLLMNAMSHPFPIDHDLHCHSHLSSCSSDPAQTTEAMLAHAKANDLKTICVTDHFWDSPVPGASDWYGPQNFEHICKNLPLPKDDEVRFLFGCETEFCGGKKLAIAPEHYDAFDFIVIPPNHFHMKDFVRPSSYDTAAKIADLLVERLEQLQAFDLPWRKVGIAHMVLDLIFKEGDHAKVYGLVDEKRFRAAMRFFADHGTGIEINCWSFLPGWRKDEEAFLRLYRLAKDEGCKFYLASDAHHPEEMELVTKYAPEVCESLGLTEADCYRVP